MATKTAQQIKTISAAFGFPFNVDKYIDAAIRTFPQDPIEYAYALILRSKEFRNRFPGIFNDDGRTLRISVPEYLNREERFASIASQHGFGLTRAQVGGLVRRNVDPDEFVLRARGIQVSRAHPGLKAVLQQEINAWNASERAQGKPGITNIRTTKDLIDFFANRADQTVYDIYEAARNRQLLGETGVDVTAKEALSLARQTAGMVDDPARAAAFGAARAPADVEVDAELSDVDQAKVALGIDNPRLRSTFERIVKQRDARLRSTLAQQRTAVDQQGRPVTPQPTAPGY